MRGEAVLGLFASEASTLMGIEVPEGLSGRQIPRMSIVQISSASISATCLKDGVVYYVIAITNGAETYSIFKRYQQFAELHKLLIRKFPDLRLPDLPRKQSKIIVDHLDEDFISRRQKKISGYIQALLSTEKVESSAEVLLFFSSDLYQSS